MRAYVYMHMYVYMYINASIHNSLFKEKIIMETEKCLELKINKSTTVG